MLYSWKTEYTHLKNLSKPHNIIHKTAYYTHTPCIIMRICIIYIYTLVHCLFQIHAHENAFIAHTANKRDNCIVSTIDTPVIARLGHAYCRFRRDNGFPVEIGRTEYWISVQYLKFQTHFCQERYSVGR